MTWRRAAGYAVSGGTAIYLATWLPSLFFSSFFQGEVLSHDPHRGMGAVLGAAVRVAEAGAAGPGSAAGVRGPGGWAQLLQGDVLLPLPPGAVRKIGMEGPRLVVEMAQGTLTVDRLPPGAIRRLFNQENQRVGGSPEETAGLDDGGALREAALANPGGFRMTMTGRERSRYAAALLTKMLVWEPFPEAAGAGGERPREASGLSIDLLGSSGAGCRGALLSGAGGPARALVAVPEGVFVLATRGPCPAEWLSEPERWGEVEGAPPAVAALWRSEARRRHPGGHPLRAWAERPAGDTAPPADPAPERPARP